MRLSFIRLVAHDHVALASQFACSSFSLQSAFASCPGMIHVLKLEKYRPLSPAITGE